MYWTSTETRMNQVLSDISRQKVNKESRKKILKTLAYILYLYKYILEGLPWWLSGEESAFSARDRL